MFNKYMYLMFLYIFIFNASSKNTFCSTSYLLAKKSVLGENFMNLERNDISFKQYFSNLTFETLFKEEMPFKNAFRISIFKERRI